MKKNAVNCNCEKTFKGQRGFTLIEVMIAVSILTVGLLGVASMQLSAIRGNNFSDNTTTALALAEEKMEYLLGRPETDPELAEGNNSEADLIDESGQAGGIYNRTWDVVDVVDPSTGTSYKEIRMTVSWDNDRHRVMLSCIKRP